MTIAPAQEALPPSANPPAMLEPPAAEWATVPRFPLYGVAVGLRSLYNVGAVFRASDAARVSHLYLTGAMAHPARHGERIDKTALGAIEAVAWSYVRDPLPVIDGLRARGIKVAALELTETSRPLSAVTRDWFPLALVVGHETDGVPAEILNRCDAVLALETFGRKPSLNVALAYGVAMLELARRWAETTGR